MTQIENNWRYGQVKSNALNVRRKLSRKARRLNNVWPMNRLVLVKPYSVDGWCETLFCGEPAYVMAEFIKLLDKAVPQSIVERISIYSLRLAKLKWRIVMLIVLIVASAMGDYNALDTQF